MTEALSTARAGTARKAFPCPEHPTFPEKLALALAAGRTPRQSGERVHEHRGRIEKAAREILHATTGISKPGRTPDSDLELFFVAFRSDQGVGRIVPTVEYGPPLPGYGDIAASNALGDTKAGALGPDVPSTALDTRLKSAAASLGIEELRGSHLARLRKKWRDGGYREYLVTLEQAYDSEWAMLDSLLEIQEQLGRWNIPMNVDVVQLRLASLWSIIPES